MGVISTNYGELSSFYNDESKIKNDFNYDEINLSDKERLSDPIFKSIGYPSKIFYKTIQKFINVYTKEGGIVIDTCSGSGSTGLAALFEGRKAILVDSSPHAVNMAYNTINYVDLIRLEQVYQQMLAELEEEINDIYFTKTSDNLNGYADVIIASNVYTCPDCNSEIVLYKNETGKRSEYKCKECECIINISKKEIKDRQIDKRRPIEVTVRYKDSKGKLKRDTKPITDEDIQLWQEKFDYYNNLYGHYWQPSEKIIYNRCYPRKGGWPGFPIDSTVSDLFPPKNLLALKIINNWIETKIVDKDIKDFMKFIFLESLFRTSSRLFTASGIKNVYHIPPVGKEQNVLTVFKRKYRDIVKGKEYLLNHFTKEQIHSSIRIINGNAQAIEVKSNSIDYALIDPPYGGMVPYAELNLFYSAWLNQKEDLENEIVIPMDFEKKDGYVELWGEYIEKAFGEIYRVLRPGAHFTIVFHSTYNNIWNELKDIMLNRLGFEFVNIIENERGTTFHTNQLNDTNPVSAFITYRKPENVRTKSTNNSINIFEIFNKIYSNKEMTFREIQSKIIILAHENNIDYIPSDKEIKEWLDINALFNQNKYIIKSYE